MNTAPDRINLWHGYSLDDLDRLARIATVRAFSARLLDPTDRYEIAWGAIVEALAAAAEPIPGGLLVMTGATAINRAGQDYRHTWGMSRDWYSVEGDVRAYQRYWELARQPMSSHEDAVVDRLALRQIWPRLSPTHQRVLMAFAIHGTHAAAAASLGKKLVTYRTHLKDARADFRRLWHEHETPSRMWGRSGERGRHTAMQTLANRHRLRARRAAAAA